MPVRTAKTLPISFLCRKANDIFFYSLMSKDVLASVGRKKKQTVGIREGSAAADE
jgi:hypothetical protein